MTHIEPLSDNDLPPPDITPWQSGNTGIAFAHHFKSGAPGPHVLINALMHGNEYAGAIAAIDLLQAGIRPKIGSLTISFANVEAFGQFDPRFPLMSRYVDEDMNRVWSPASLADGAPSQERQRARELWPLFATADLLLDLHSMQHDRIPLMLCGGSERGRDLALRLAHPAVIVSDQGHTGGSRLIDHPRFTGGNGPVALLAECGQHWDPDSAVVARQTIARFLLHCGVVDASALAAWLPPEPPPARLVQVTQTVTVQTDYFQFQKHYRGLDVIPMAGTLFAMDGEKPLHTPFDDCVLIMPSLLAERGQTAVRLGRFT